MPPEKHILLLEDDHDIADMLVAYFSGHGYRVTHLDNGDVAMAQLPQLRPDLILCDIMVPGMDGFALCRAVRNTPKLAHIPFIFLTQKDDRADKIAGLEIGADDYITKPFDIDALRLRIQSALRAATRSDVWNTATQLPTARQAEDHLRSLLGVAASWAYLDLKINDFESFKLMYGFMAGDEVQRFTAQLLTDVTQTDGTSEDFIAHPGGDHFIVMTHVSDPERLRNTLVERFNAEIKQHYSFLERERGHMLVPDSAGNQQQVSLMTLAVGVVSNTERQFADIREIMELAQEKRSGRKITAKIPPVSAKSETSPQQDQNPSLDTPSQNDADILTSW